MEKIKTFNQFNNESLNENWKNWAVALGIASASLFAGNVQSQTKLKDKIESIKDKVNDKLSKDLVLKTLEEDGYKPLDNTLASQIMEKGKLVDNNIEILSNTQSAAKLSLIQKVKDNNFKYEDGFIVYKDIPGSKIKMKWITYEGVSILKK